MSQMNQVLCGGCQIMLMYPQSCHIPYQTGTGVEANPHRMCGLHTGRQQGAANVRCSQCQHVTPVAAPTPPTSAPPTSGPPGGPAQQQGQAPRAQLQCAGCQIMLMYPRGAANVQCAVCGVVSSAAQANTVAHLQCTGCRTWLMYSYGARSVKCAVCETINKQIPEGDAAIPPVHPMFQPNGVAPINGVQGPPGTAAPNGIAPTNGANSTAPAGGGPDAGNAGADAGSGGAAVKQEPPPENTPPVVVQNPVTVDEKGNKVEEVMLGYKDTGT